MTIQATALLAGDIIITARDAQGFAADYTNENGIGVVRKVERGRWSFADGQDGWYEVSDAVIVEMDDLELGGVATIAYEAEDEVRIRRSMDDYPTLGKLVANVLAELNAYDDDPMSKYAPSECATLAYTYSERRVRRMVEAEGFATWNAFVQTVRERTSARFCYFLGLLEDDNC